MTPQRLMYYRLLAYRGHRAAQRVVDAFNPDQPREADGKWGDGGGASGAGSKSGEPTPAARERLTSREFLIVNKPVEWGCVVDREGRAILDKVGEKTEVSFSGDEIEQMKDRHFTHNHPSGSSLSKEDLNLALDADLASMSAVGKSKIDGKTYRYSFTRPKAGWPSSQMVKSVTREIESDLKNDFYGQIAKGRMSVQEANHSHTHELWTRVATTVDINYRREELKP